MKRRLGLLLLLTASYFSIKAQSTAPLYLGTKTPYYPLQKKHTPPPAGYTPVFINHVGRHGARFLTKAGSDVLVLDVLEQAAKQNALTAVGQQARQAAMQFESVETGNYENITLKGAEEQTGIAARMNSEYRDVFKQRGLSVMMTAKVRTQQSAEAFLKGIAYPSEKIKRTIGANAADTVLRFYDLSPAYTEYKTSKKIKQHIDSLYSDPAMEETSKQICNRIFKSSFLRQIANKTITANNGQGKQKAVSEAAFATALYEVYTMQFSASRETEQRYPKESADMKAAFTNEDLKWFDMVNGAEDFFEKGPATDTLGIQITIATPLLDNFINTSDSVLNGSKLMDAILRFTHAEAISPFATLLGIPQASVQSNSVYTYQHHWQASKIVPLSANIQWVFYFNGKDYLLKVLLNEQEVALPFKTSTFPYYKWQEARSYYTKKLKKIMETGNN